MKTCFSSRSPQHLLAGCFVAGLCLVAATSPAFGQGKKKNPASKVFVSDVNGEAQIDTGDTIQDLSKRSVYTAQGTIIETKRPENEGDRGKNYSTMVYSNGTGAFFDADTRVEVQRFVQEPFTPNRADVEFEPSISQTQAFIARGAVGLCTSKLVAGSSMTYQTPHGSVNIRGRKIVIETSKEVTKISMLEGDSTVRAGSMDMGGHTVHSGEQAIIRPGGPGMPNSIEIVKIPENDVSRLDDKVSMACMAKKTVYFDVQEKKEGEGDDAAGADNGPITAFDDDNGKPGEPVREIVPIEVTPTNPSSDHVMTTSRSDGTGRSGT